MAAPVVWFEIAGRDLEGMRKFYGDLLGWKLDTDNPVQYGLVDTGAEGGIPGGIFAPGEGVEYVTFYAEVPDLKKSLVAAEKLGAKVVAPPMEVMGGSTVALIHDPEGHPVGLIQPPA